MYPILLNPKPLLCGMSPTALNVGKIHFRVYRYIISYKRELHTFTMSVLLEIEFTRSQAHDHALLCRYQDGRPIAGLPSGRALDGQVLSLNTLTGTPNWLSWLGAGLLMFST